MGDLAQVEVEQRGDACIVRISGEIDLSNAEEVRQVLEESSSNLSRLHVVDLSQTRYLDSSGMRLLFNLAERLRVRKRELHLIVPDDAVIRRVLDLSGIPAVARIHASWRRFRTRSACGGG